MSSAPSKEQLPLIQHLDPQGNLHGKPQYSMSADEHKLVFETMVKVRLFEDRCMKLQRQGRIGFYIGAYGQEASHVASAQALRKQDWVYPSYRELGVLLLRGIPVQQIVHQLYGNASEHTLGAQMPCHYSFRQANFVSISSPIGTHLPHAVGTAMAAKYKGDDVVTCSYIGDGGTSEGDFHVALNFAGVYKAPTIIIVENNQWAISCPSNEQTSSPSYAIKAMAYGMEGVRVDGNDVLAVYSETRKAVEKAKRGDGPTLIENVTYRLFSHSSSDDADRYRDKVEYEAALKNEPLLRYRKYLGAQKIWNEKWESDFSEKFKEEVNEAIKRAEAAPRPDTSSIFERVFAQTHPILDEQQALLKEELKERQSWEEDGAFPL